ncbi:PAS domain S-box protein [Spirochaeta dissipatitropha]
MGIRYLLGIGASAGGLEALQALLGNFEFSDDETAVVIAQHISPSYKSQLVELLSRQTGLSVNEAVDGDIPEPGNVYITPPDRDIAFSSGSFLLTKPVTGHGPRPSVDRFFQSMAEAFGSGAAAVILSGTGSDGAQGSAAICRAGGLVIAQDPATAKYDGMPRSAIESGNVDLVAAPDVIGSKLPDWCRIGAETLRSESAENENTPDESSVLQSVLQKLSDHTGTDFGRYKPATISRRLEKRLTSLGMESIEEYLPVLESDSEELQRLFSTILIGVTYFFRDSASFDLLREHLEQLLTGKNRNDKLRIWIPGCASGEEAYSIALLIADILKEQDRHLDCQIFATDLDEQALSTARRARYSEKALENVPEKMRETWFNRQGTDYELIPFIRNQVLFSRHDVSSNPPFLKLDLISCRNLLIYFGSELQQQVLSLFHYALQPHGILFLGKSETVGALTDLFDARSSTHKIYRRKSGVNPYFANQMRFRSAGLPRRLQPDRRKEDYTVSDMVKDTLYHSFEHPYVVVNSQMEVVEISGDVRAFLSIKSGAMNASLISLIDEAYEMEIRSLLSEAIREHSAVESKPRWFSTESDELLRFVIKPVLYSGTTDSLFIVIFECIQMENLRPRITRKEDDIQSHDEMRVQELEIELASTREHLQNYIEELETSTEELQSLNEELQSTNEELQSSNEELETSNEELQSTNEELQIAYAELKEVSQELERQRVDLKEAEMHQRAVLSNTLQAFLLLDRSYRLIVINERGKELFHQITGYPLAPGALIIENLPGSEMEFFQNAFSRCGQGESVAELRKIYYPDQSIHWLSWNFTPVSEDESGIPLISIAVLDVSESKEMELSLKEQKLLNQLMLDSAQVGISLTDSNGRFVEVNPAYCTIYGYNRDELIGEKFTMLLPPGMHDYASKLHTRFLNGETEESAGEWEVVRKDGSRLFVMVGAGRLERSKGEFLKLTSVVDITAQKMAEEERNRLFTVSLDLIGILRYDGFLQHVNPSWQATLGFTEEELKSKPVVDFLHPEDRKTALDFIRTLIEESGLSLEDSTGTTIAESEARGGLVVRCMTADGAFRWLSWKIAAVPAQRLLYAVARDVTDSRRYENLLRDTQRVARVGGWELDLSSGRTSWTDEVYRIYDVPLGQATDYMFGLQAYEEEDRQLVKDAVEKASLYGESTDLELRFTSSTGRKLWVRVTFKGVESDNRTEKVLGTIQDITGQKLAELENRRLSLVASRTDSGVIIADRDFRIQWVNQGFTRLTGLALETIVSKPIGQAFLGLDADRTAVKQISQKMGSGSSMHHELQIVGMGGSEIWLRLDITPVDDEEKKPENWIVLLHDITGEKDFQKQLIIARDRAEEMNKLKNAFLANISHEIRTPINGILGMGNIIQRETQQDNVREYAEMLEKSAQRLLHTINQVLDLSRIEARQTDLKFERVELNELSQRLTDSVMEQASGKQLRLHLHLASAALFVHADAYLIENILLNLLDNAIKFTAEGSVVVKTETRSRKGRTFAAVEIRDTGVGISPDYLKQIFLPFSQESSGHARKFEGTGIGLAISQEYARMMDGIITVSSRKGEGSSFRLLLPLQPSTEKS